ncbi:MAG TPA: hypothetical protein VF747_11640 [Blastocatellia bacterium]
MFRKTENGVIENLLRAHAARAGGPPLPCREFDPDLANAFIEHSLAASERGRYEQHLSLCASCRKSVVALARMAASDAVFSSEARPRGVIWEAEPRWRALLGAMARPQWAMAAAAVIILAVSVPLFLSGRGGTANQTRPESKPESKVEQSPSNNDAAAEARTVLQAPGSDVNNGVGLMATNDEQSRATPKASRAAEYSEKATDQPSAEKASGVVGGAVARLEPPRLQPVEANPAGQNIDHLAAGEASQIPSAAGVPVPQQEPEDQLAKIDPDKAKSVPAEQSKDTEVSVLQPGRADGGDARAKRDAVVRPDEIAPPPSAPSSRTRGRSNAITSAPGGLNSRLTDSARLRGGASERKIGGKKFWLKDNIWVDKDYNPDKEMPVITIIRDSDVYKELLVKRQGMKSFLTEFDEKARVIFIYKGTVYKLIPQEGNK